MAVLTRLEPTTDLAIIRASSSLGALTTLTSINLVAPSPSLAIFLAKSCMTKLSMAENFSKSAVSGKISLLRVQPFDRTKTISFVEVSPSTVIWLKVFSTFCERASCRVSLEITASQVIKASMVAILGWIMPEPLATPAMVTSSRPNISVTATVLISVSVVSMALEKSSALPLITNLDKPFFRVSIGKSSPMTPVEATATVSGSTPNFSAVHFCMV